MTVFEQGFRALDEARTRYGGGKYSWLVGMEVRRAIFEAGTAIALFPLPSPTLRGRVLSWLRSRVLAVRRFFGYRLADMSFCGIPAFLVTRVIESDEAVLLRGKKIAGRFWLEAK